MSKSSNTVGRFYDRFPYPGDPVTDAPPPGYNWRWCFDAAYSSCSGALKNTSNIKFSPKILDAGCGTGVSTDYLAYLNPGSDILAIDISENALKIAEERLLRSGAHDISNIAFEKKDLYDLTKEKYFDYINSVGVLHHLSQPLLGLKKLASHLLPGGLLHLFLYAESGRREIRSVQRVFKSLGISSNDEGIGLGRQLILDLPEHNKLRQNYQSKWANEGVIDVNFADMYLHPREVNYSIDTLFELIDQSDLSFAGFSNPKTWDLGRFLTGEMLSCAKELSRRKQWKLIEDLDQEISHFEFFLAKEPLPIYRWQDDSDLLSAHEKISPCIWGWPRRDLLDRDMTPLVLSVQSFEFLDVLHASSPGTLLQDLPLNWSLTQIATTARDLYMRHVILLSAI